MLPFSLYAIQNDIFRKTSHLIASHCMKKKSCQGTRKTRSSLTGHPVEHLHENVKYCTLPFRDM